ncbi:hypothetical protein ThesuDRAFT_00201 [Thermaerobacter subterraneus DSM 13965]|uniref:Uncharacterized protein n=1 Tax=Thermaerobacter subterraneus DSM 13965 TaxID=867903 RepID=K6PY32_9FIRM|nr:hypothetical protein ThesuDRAFT_00201 [Thermaerobacter subterraneus DSM 13965]
MAHGAGRRAPPPPRPEARRGGGSEEALDAREPAGRALGEAGSIASPAESGRRRGACGRELTALPASDSGRQGTGVRE